MPTAPQSIEIRRPTVGVFPASLDAPLTPGTIAGERDANPLLAFSDRCVAVDARVWIAVSGTA
jgi:hypothetical protein